jgi:hypothetical protein
VTARIFIEDRPSRLDVESEILDFGDCPIGRHGSLPLVIQNGGGGVLEGKAHIGDPWSLTGNKNFQLEAGVARKLQVCFSPVGPGEFRGLLEFQGGSKPYRRVELRGKGVYRFQVEERLTIENQTDGGWIEIANLDSEDLTLEVEAPKPLVCEPKIVIPAGGSKKLKVGLQDGIYTENSVNLVLEDGAVLRTVRVDLPPPPVRLEWHSAPRFDMGSFPLRSRPELPIGLTNSGVRNATVRIVADPSLSLAPSQTDSFEIQAGKTATVKAVWSLPEELGEARATISALQDGIATDLELIAQVVSEHPPPPEVKTKNPSPVSPPPVINSRLKSMGESVAGAKFERKEISGKLNKNPPAFSDLTTQVLQENGVATAILSWKYQGPKPVKFRIERKSVERASLDPGKVFEKRLEVPDQLPVTPVTEKWTPVEESTSNLRCLDGTAWEARLPGLPTGWSALRIVMIMPDTEPWATRPIPIEVGTLPRPPWMNWAMAGLVLFGLYVLRQKIAGWLGVSIQR